MSTAALVRQAESTRESRFAELSAREQAMNLEFATSVNLRIGGRTLVPGDFLIGPLLQPEP
jgi:hypothetical protein